MSELEWFLWKVESFTSSAASRGSSRSSTVALLGNFSQSVNGELRTATDVNASLCVCIRVFVCVRDRVYKFIENEQQRGR